jgi:hypothetical protein
LQGLARDLKKRGKLDLAECFIDGAFIVAKKGAAAWERATKRGKGTKRMAMATLADRAGLPLAAASPARGSPSSPRRSPPVL